MRLIRFIYLSFLSKVIKVVLPTFSMSYGHNASFKNIWLHSKRWRFNWE